MDRLWSRLVADRRGATAIEYGLLGGLIALALIGALTLLGEALDVKFDFIDLTIRQS